MRSYVYIALVATMAAAKPYLPHPTMDMANAMLQVNGWSPVPTEGPSMDLLEKRLNIIHARQASLSSGQLVGYFAQDSICGYISGSIGAPVRCGTSSRCAAIAGSPGAVGCCPNAGTGCYFITTCYNLADIQSSKCDAGCQQDSDVQACTATSAPYCFASTWADISATIWGCNAQQITTRAPISLNFLGATSTKTWSAYYYTPSASSSNGIVSAASSLRSASSAGASRSASPTPSIVSKSSTNVGAIVGGVVGGLAVLGLLAFGIIFLLLRKRKSKKNAAAASANTQGAYPNNGGPQMDQQQQQQYYGAGAPVGGAAAGYYGTDSKAPMSNTTGSPVPSPGSAYLQPAAVGGAGGMSPDGSTMYSGGGDNRVSAYSDSGSSPATQYQQTPQGYHSELPAIPQHQQQAPMELHGDSSHVMSSQGQPIYEAPANAPGSRP